MTVQFDEHADRSWDGATPRERLARLLLIRSDMDSRGAPTERTIEVLRAGIGAVHGPPLLEREGPAGPTVARDFNAEIHRLSAEHSGIPVLIGANAERGLSYTTRTGGTDVPYAAALGIADPALSESVGRTVGREFAATGYDWVFQPVIDVRTAVHDPVIGVRAFGSDPDTVAEHGVAFVRGLQRAGVLAAAKHFPGHGDAEVDSHLGLPIVSRDRADHESIHLEPFRRVIDAGVASLMTAHLLLPELGIDEIATFSREICTDLLRGELGFEGLLVTDSLRMAAVADKAGYAQAFVSSLHAGCDVMNIRCWPDEVDPLLDELERLYATGAIDETAVHTAFVRVVRASQRAVPDPGPLPSEDTGTYTDIRLPQLLERHDPGGELPLRLEPASVLGVLVDSPRDTDAPPLSLLSTLEVVAECEVRRIRVEQTEEVDAVLAVSYGQAGPSPTEIEYIERAAAAARPAAALIAGPLAALPSTKLPTVMVPTIDVFGMASRATLVPAVEALVQMTEHS
ncbi:glycoside hydrolase family 3 protein [Brachybacterium sp. AOP29-B2-41]|uniref:glycoside hydrolase family 3 protein n=1 Tax=Brachybacterium sp. AOP29-B2-41 TaxID=3457704 RepID=UPI00403431F2